MKKIIYSILPILLSGCAFYNPFVPPSTVVECEGEALPIQEPITSDAMYKSTMKNYTVNGVTYKPIIPKVGQTFVGTASWYGPNFHGGKTANGEYYDMTTYTAAHKTLPMNTMLRVTNLKNGLSTIVRINDRGPFVQNRIIDLSEAAARDIGMIKSGTTKVKLEVIDFDTNAKRFKQYDRFPMATKSIDEIKTQTKTDEQISPLQESSIKSEQITKTQTNTNSAYQIQLFSSTDQSRAKKIAQKYAKIDDRYHSMIKSKSISGQKLYKVVIGDFNDALKAKEFIQKKGLKGAFVIKD